MWIKKLELNGFKSFCEPTRITFEPKCLTAVVGPNGCGKSNIVDAIRWVMGEQSPRNLRAKSAEDLIFGGSERRGPVGMAEVTMVLDLSDGVAPAKYAGFSELEVTRRIFRDGTSEYFIQKIPCRLKDIVELFLGGGAHSRSYAIIEQARVERILMARPEERRSLIEEAAGITSFKAKRAAAERRLESTRQNLVRVEDLLSEITRRLNSLRRQAKKAERYERYEAELRDLSLWRTAHRRLELLLEERRLGEELEGVRGRGLDLADSLAAREARLEADRLTLAEEEANLSRVQEQVYELTNRLELTESRAAYQAKERERLLQEAERARGEAEALRTRLEQAERELAEAGRDVEQLEAEVALHEALLEVRQEVQSGLRKEAERAREALDEVRDRLAALEREIAGAEGRRTAWQGRRHDLEERLAEVERELTDLGEEIAGLGRRQEELLEREKASQDELETLEVQADALASRAREVSGELGKLDEALEEVREGLHRDRSRLDSLEEIQQRYEGFQDGTRAVMAGREAGDLEGIRGVVADIFTVPAEWEAALEAALGDRIGAVLVEDLEAGISAVQYLRSGNFGRASFVAGGNAPARSPAPRSEGVLGRLLDRISVAEGFIDLAEELLGDVYVAGSLDDAVSLWRQSGGKVAFVTQEGDFLEATGLLHGGGQDREGAGILARKREIEELAERVEELTIRQQRLLSAREELRRELAAVEQELEAVRERIHREELGLLETKKDLAALEGRAREVQRRREVLLGQQESLSAALDRGSREAEEAAGLVAQSRREAQALRERLGQTEAAAERAVRLAEEAAAALGDVRVSAAQARERLDAARERLEKARQEQVELLERRARLEEQARKGVERAEELAGQAGELSREAEELAGRLDEASRGLSELRERCERLRTKVSEQELEVRSLREEVSSLGRREAEVELALERVRMEGQHLAADAAQRWRIELNDVLLDHHLRPPWGSMQEARLAELEQLLDRMRADYNPMARREYDELRERHEFLASQKADLEEALERLGEAIRKIDRTSRQRFLETFEEVNKRFRQLFPRLFGGGKAELVLTDPQDALASGIEIVAQPPGKKRQSVELMSGGEKALMAISLIFSIFLYRPSPFCILDEVDAPLDDVNVERYNVLLREMAAFTQFIVVTHNKRTMEAMDTLLGVTMDEPGVSKVVRVNLRDAQELAA